MASNGCFSIQRIRALAPILTNSPRAADQQIDFSRIFPLAILLNNKRFIGKATSIVQPQNAPISATSATQILSSQGVFRTLYPIKGDSFCSRHCLVIAKTSSKYRRVVLTWFALSQMKALERGRTTAVFCRYIAAHLEPEL